MNIHSSSAIREFDFVIDLSGAERERANRLHNELVFWNACDSSQSEYADAAFIEKIRSSAITAVNHTVAYSVSFQTAVRYIAKWSKLYEDHSDVTFVGRDYADVARAKETGRTAIFMGFQDITAIEGDLSLLAVFHRNSSVVPVLEATRSGQAVTFESETDNDEVAASLFAKWTGLLQALPFTPDTDWQAFEPYTAREMTRRQCELFDAVVAADVCRWELSG